MSRFTRHKNTKRLVPRTGGGQFAGKPSLGAVACRKCGALHLPEMVEVNGFITKKNPVNCKNGCGPLAGCHYSKTGTCPYGDGRCDSGCVVELALVDQEELP